MTSLDEIKQAIESKNKIEITYDDDKASRILYPHALYKNHQGNTILDAYQAGGYTSSEVTKLPQWKMFNVDLIKKVSVWDEKFRKIVSFNPDSDRYKNAITVIK